jgi:hypothetical protein
MVLASAIIWGVLAYSLLTMGTITGLSIKVALLFKERGALRRKLDTQERATKAAEESAEANNEALARARKEVEVLREELEEMDVDLDGSGAISRLERLLSGPVSDGGKDSDADPVPAPKRPDAD